MTDPKSEAPDLGDAINDLVNYALVQWAKVTGSDPEQRRFFVRLGGNDGWTDWYKTRHVQAIEASRDMDPSGLTAFLMLRGGMEEYLKGTAFSALAMITDPEGVERAVAPLRALRAVLEHPRVVRLVDDFRASIAAAADFYHLEPKHRAGLEELLADKYRLAFIVRDAHRSMATLEHHQFAWGKPDPATFRYAPDVWEYWNVNSLLRAVSAQRMPGLTMVLIRDPDVALFSFFAITVSNGESITLLTDRQRTAHPDHKFMTRRPDRTFAERADRHWFPYHLMGVEVTPDQKGLYATQVKALVPVDATGARIGTIREFEPETFVWTVLLMELVRQQYGHQNHQLPAPSYTGEMIVEPHALVGQGADMVRTGRYEPMVVEPLRAADVTHETTAPQWQSKQKGHNRWLMERYAHLVPDAALNPVGAAQLPAAMEAVREATTLEALEEGVRSTHGIFRRSHRHAELSRDDRKVHGDVQLRPMDPLAFDTRANLERDRLWCARVNQVKVVQSLAYREFDATRAELLTWCRAALERNAAILLDAAAAGAMPVPHVIADRAAAKDWLGFDVPLVEHPAVNRLTQESRRTPGWFGLGFWAGVNDDDDPGYVPPSRRRDAKRNGGVRSAGRGNFILSGGISDSQWYCYASPDDGATVATHFAPNCAGALAVLFGVKVEELPWQLRHWTTVEPYTGNSILDRVDPEECWLKDPWRALGMQVYLYASKRHLNARAKALKLPPRDWDAIRGDRKDP